MPLAGTSAGYDSLPGTLTQIFIPEGSEPLVILPGLSCSSLLLTLITGHGNKRCPNGCLVIPDMVFLTATWGAVVQLATDTQDLSLQPAQQFPYLPVDSKA